MITARRSQGRECVSRSGRWLAALAVALAGVVILVLGPISNGNEGESCAGATPIDLTALPNNVAGYRHEQLVNAAHIIQAGRNLGLTCRDQTIGVMTAMGESSLLVLDHGDTVGPDSRGLFQQRGNGAWGSYADRMDPYTSATNFLTVLSQVDERDALKPTIAAHRVQRNADPYHYRPYWSPAQDVVAAITATSSE